MYQSTTLNGPKKVNAALRKKRSFGGKVGMRSSPRRNGSATTKSVVVSETRKPLSKRSVNVPSAFLDPTDTLQKEIISVQRQFTVCAAGRGSVFSADGSEWNRGFWYKRIPGPLR